MLYAFLMRSGRLCSWAAPSDGGSPLLRVCRLFEPLFVVVGFLWWRRCSVIGFLSLSAGASLLPSFPADFVAKCLFALFTSRFLY